MPPEPAMTNKSGILVTGTHHSGSTWVGRVLACSPGVAYLHEPFNPDYRPSARRIGCRYWYTHLDKENEAKYVDSFRSLLGYHQNLRREMAPPLSLKDMARAVRNAGTFAWWRYHAYRPLIKDPIALLSAEWLHQTFGVQVVVLVRHPAAFAFSIKRRNTPHPFDHFLAQPILMSRHLAPYAAELRNFAEEEKSLIDQACLLWRILNQVVIAYREQHPDWIVIRYEDLVREPETYFGILFDRLDLRFTQQVRSKIGNPGKMLNWWKRELAPEEIERIRASTESVSSAFYKPDEW